MREAFRSSGLLFLFCLWLSTGVGIVSVPLETHEVFVLETARAMEASGDWVFPQFNGAPRLTKPPANYWLTAALSKLDPFSSDVQIWHGRLVSLLAGLLMVWATLRLGALVYGWRTGLLAAALLTSTQGFVHLSNSARPDFLYATLGCLQLLAWVAAWKAQEGTWQQRGLSLAGWAAAAAGTLTKGPQVPVLLLLGLAAYLLRKEERKRLPGILCPLSGAALFGLIVLPWWVLLNRRMRVLGIELSDTQLSGSLLHNLAGWHELLSAYYLWTLFVLLLPAGLAIPFLLPHLWRSRAARNGAARLLVTVAGTLLVVFTVGGHYRKHYLLPLLPVAALFLARAVETLPAAPLPGRARKAAVAVLALAALGGAGLAVYRQSCGALALLPVVALLLAPARRLFAELVRQGHALAAQALVAAALTTVAVSVYHAELPMTQWRVEEQAFSAAVGRMLTPGDQVAVWRTTLATLPYFSKRRVELLAELGPLSERLAESRRRGHVFVVLPESEREAFDALFAGDEVRRTHFSRAKKSDLVCVQIRGLRAPPGAAPN